MTWVKRLACIIIAAVLLDLIGSTIYEAILLGSCKSKVDLLVNMALSSAATEAQTTYYADSTYFVGGSDDGKIIKPHTLQAANDLNSYYSSISSMIQAVPALNDSEWLSVVKYLNANSDIFELEQAVSPSQVIDWSSKIVTPLSANMTYISPDYLKYKFQQDIEGDIDYNFGDKSDSKDVTTYNKVMYETSPQSFAISDVDVSVGDPELIKLDSSSGDFVGASIFGQSLSDSELTSLSSDPMYDYVIMYPVTAKFYWSYHTSAPFFKKPSGVPAFTNSHFRWDSKGQLVLMGIESTSKLNVASTN